MSGTRTPKTEEEFPTAVPPPWIELPADVTANILQRLEVVDILQSAENVCTTWRRITCSDPSIWRVIHIKRADFGNQRICNLCRRAVDRSQGQLVDLSIEDLGNDDNLLNYTVDRSSDLKRLSLERCNGITGKAVVEAVITLQHLEELRLIESQRIYASDIVNIGISCPVLKSFTFTRYLYGYYGPGTTYDLHNRNECAFAIAKNMPNLCHLCLDSGLFIDHQGLEAILDGCPNLVSLDLRQCFGLDLGDALVKRLSQQIKHLKLHLDHFSIQELIDIGSDDDDDYYDDDI